jgi:hypothetical protein
LLGICLLRLLRLLRLFYQVESLVRLQGPASSPWSYVRCSALRFKARQYIHRIRDRSARLIAISTSLSPHTKKMSPPVANLKLSSSR